MGVTQACELGFSIKSIDLHTTWNLFPLGWRRVSRGQQLPTSTVNIVDRGLLPPPETLDGLPEILRGWLVVLLHGLPKLFPDPSFCFRDCPCCRSPGLPVPVSCFRSPPGQPGSVGLLLQLDSIPYFRSPPPGLGIAATTGTGDPTATAPDSRINNGSGEHGPFGLNVPSLPQDLGKALPEVGVTDLPARGFRQTFPADPHNAFGSARSFPASSPASRSDSPQGGDRLTAQPLSSPECPRHMAWCQMTWLQSWSLTSGLGYGQTVTRTEVQ